jgi:putative ABC transport system permease protein
MGSIRRDLRYALRLFARNPSATFAAVFTLALGIGANVAVFSVVNSVLLRALPFRDPGRLVFIHETRPDVPTFGASYPDYEDWRRENTTFEEMGAYSIRNYNRPVLMVGGEPLQLTVALVSDNLFSLMSIRPALGRAFLSQEGRPGEDRVVILSNSLWEQQFACDPGVLGKSIEIDGADFNVVGVMGKTGQFPQGADIWLPLSQLGEGRLLQRRNRTVSVIGRLKSGVSEKQAFAELKAIQSRIAIAYPEADNSVGVVQVSLMDQYTGGIRTLLMILLGAASLVLLISCANIANLLLARTENRRREIAIRVAHGATRNRVFGQLLTESLGLAVLSTLGGLAIAFGGIVVVRHWALRTSHIPRLATTSLDPTVLIYTIGVSVLTGLLFGTLPAIQASRIDFNEALKQGGRTSRASMGGRSRSFLIVFEVAVAVIVLISTGLLVKTFANLVQARPGFRTDDLLTVQMRISGTKYSDYSKTETFYLQLLENIKTSPGVKGSAAINILPIVPSLSLMHFGVEGMAPRRLEEYPVGQTRGVSPGYFELMNIPIRAGRSFQDSDLGNVQRGCIINETLARTYFRDQNPIGRKILAVEAPTSVAIPIVGVAADVRDLGVDRDAEPEMYFLGFGPDEVLLVHTAVDPLSLAGAIRGEVRALDPYQPVGEIRTMQNIVDESFSRRKVLASLMASFSGLALILAGVGIYGVMSYSIVLRTSEIGVRRALGATWLDIVRLLLRQGMMPVMIGLTIGLAGAWSIRRLLSALLYQVSSTDSTTYLSIVAMIILTAACATLVPSVKATRTDPLTALRWE